jgi:PadR family transcriptional regulator AphA
MSIKYAILGLLSCRPMSGYDIKKIFMNSVAMYWSGNNNQIYKTLIGLHKEKLISREIQHQESSPSRKVYTITEEGTAELEKWVLSEPELPQLKHPFLIQLQWAGRLEDEQLADLLEDYRHQLLMRLMLYKGQKQRKNSLQAGTPREALLWDMILENWVGFYEHELDWLGQLQEQLAKKRA